MDYIRRNRLEIEILENMSQERHFHQDLEVLYVLDGTLYLIVGERKMTLKAGDIYVVNANKVHCFTMEKGTLAVKLMVTYRLISDIFVDEPLFFLCDSTSDPSEKYVRLKNSMNRLLRFYFKNRGNKANFRYIALGYEFLDILASDFLVRPPQQKKMDTYNKVDERLDEINNYIRANYSEALSLKKLSSRLYLSEGYLSRFFKKNYGMSFSEYLTNVRLHHAMEDIVYTDMPITKIVYSNGFSNQTVFGKLFKNIYGTTPSAFRKNARSTKAEAEVSISQENLSGRVLELLNQKAIPGSADTILSEADTNPEECFAKDSNAIKNIDLSCSAKDFEQRAVSCFRTLNVGMAEDLTRSELQEHIIELKKMVGMEYVRFWNIFTPELLIPLGKNSSEFNFSKLDRIFDFLQEQKLKPHIELGMKPRRLMRDLVSSVDESNAYGNSRGEEITLRDWERAVDSLMAHLSGRYGDAIDTWRIELWYDEDKWEQRKTVEEYFALFDIVYEIVRKYSSTLEVGGSGLKFDYLENHICGFLTAWSRREIQPDFISALYYGYERGTAIAEQSFRRSTDTNHMQKCVSKLQKLMNDSGMKKSKLYFTEWNLTVSDRNYINDTSFKGAYVIKNFVDAYGKLDDIAYYIGSDCVTEHYDSSELLYGGTGLLSRDGILKPSGYACHFFKLLFPYKVAQNENILITTNGRGAYRLICHNLVALNEHYYWIREDSVKKEDIDRYFTNGQTLQIHIELKGLQQGNYRQKNYYVNKKYGNVLHTWKEMGYEKNLSAEDISYIKRSSGPKMTMQRVICQNGCLSFSLTLEPNAFAFIQLAPVG